VLFCVLFLLPYISVYLFPPSAQSTERCHRVETELQ
jgi:hypothetical protein